MLWVSSIDRLAVESYLVDEEKKRIDKNMELGIPEKK